MTSPQTACPALEHLIERRARLTFAEGLGAPFRAVLHLAGHPSLWLICLAPLLVNLLVLCPLTYWVLDLVLFDWLRDHLPEGDTFWGALLAESGDVALTLVNIAAVGPFFLLYAIILSAAFYDKMGEWIEKDRLRRHPHLQAPEIPFWTGVRHGLMETLRRLMIVLPLFLLTFALGLLPLIGPPLVFLTQMLVASSFFALDAFGMPMDRREVPLARKLRWLRANGRYAVGFGIPFLVLPCAFLLVPPLAAVAGSLEFTDLLLEEDRALGGEGGVTRRAVDTGAPGPDIPAT
jgi:CysZ protein